MYHTALQALRSSGIRISSDTAEYHQIPEFADDLSDATTNPSLVLAAVSKLEYADIVKDAVDFAKQRLPEAKVEDVTALAMDRLLVQVGVAISRIVSGRVSVSVDPRIGYDTEAMIRKGYTLVSLLEELGVPRHRILIKIPATYEGICAARALEHPPADSTQQPIYTNMTLIFGRVQAIACAQAGLSVISPFIGRVKDWWDAHQPGSTGGSDLSQHPGILLVRDIRSTYLAHGYKTHVMAAGFRAVDEIIEVGKYGAAGGPDLVTLPPHLLAELRSRESVEPPLEFAPRDVGATTEYFGGQDPTEGASAYARDIAEEKVAAAKVPEGLTKFSADAQILEDLVRRMVDETL